MVPIELPVGTRLRIVGALHRPLHAGTVTPIAGPHKGVTGKVSAAEWANIAAERS